MRSAELAAYAFLKDMAPTDLEKCRPLVENLVRNQP
jgi:hypothetical protein